MQVEGQPELKSKLNSSLEVNLIQSQNKKVNIRLGIELRVKYLPSMCKALGSIPNTEEKVNLTSSL